ncbi:MAG: choloylglycine hydrolase family protein [Lachnospiraceae bacterium]|nr:choloylglycine hydrolase family protein [Lachnospiraceae bacterium]
MCTAATYKTNDFYFGRTLDYEHSYVDEVTITPRNYPFHFIKNESVNSHYAMIGMAYVVQGYPLYYDAVNEKGLAMAGLNFPGNAVYHESVSGKDNIAQFEFIPWILARCATVGEARRSVERMNLLNTPFNEKLPVAQLHWIISDKDESITVESVEGGIKIYENPVGILTNNPPFDMQMTALNDYMGLSAGEPRNTFAPGLELKKYGRGMGAIGLPGDLSSKSRFVRAAFVKMNSVSGDSEQESVSQFFHILNSVDQQRGCCDLGGGRYEITIYTSCCNAARGLYYYTTYDNHQITLVDMYRENLDGNAVIHYPLAKGERILEQN